MSAVAWEKCDPIVIKGAQFWEPPLIVECYRKFLPGLDQMPKPEEWALFYARHAAEAIKTGTTIHLSRKREKAPVTADISPNGDLFIAFRHSTFITSERKKIKQAWDVVRKQPVIRSVEPYGKHTDEHTEVEKEAQEDLGKAPWMVKEYHRGSYFNGAIDKQVVILEKFKSDLFDFIQKNEKLTAVELKRIMHQLLQQLADIHTRGIHKDLKTENVLIHKDLRVAIADFEFYRRLNDPKKLAQYRVGTPCMHPPEFAKKELSRSSDFLDVTTPAYDVWAMGLIFFELIYWNKQAPSWMKLKGYKQLQKIVRCSERSWIPDQDSKDPAHILMRWMLSTDPKKRPSASEALEFFEQMAFRSPSASDRTDPPSEKRSSDTPAPCEAI